MISFVRINLFIASAASNVTNNFKRLFSLKKQSHPIYFVTIVCAFENCLKPCGWVDGKSLKNNYGSEKSLNKALVNLRWPFDKTCLCSQAAVHMPQPNCVSKICVNSLLFGYRNINTQHAQRSPLWNWPRLRKRNTEDKKNSVSLFKFNIFFKY